MHIAYSTDWGKSFYGKAEEILQSSLAAEYTGKVNLIFTSPPFPLNRKKKYGNLEGQEYMNWLANFALVFRHLLHPLGSIVIEVGNSWEPRRPAMSTLGLRALLEFLERGNFVLCQQFIWNNPARLPSPAQWVNVERIRLKDAYTHLWWMSTSDRPKADNRRVLKSYSTSMQQLLKSGKYNSGRRPSEHNISQTSFLTDNNGAIPSNVITEANTQANTPYLKYCELKGLQPHPARMPMGLAEFFIKFLTEPGDLVLDPFAGSNTTGAAAEYLQRRWLSIEADLDYILGSCGHFGVETKVLETLVQNLDE